MSKLHSFTTWIVFLICGQLACAETESASSAPALGRRDAATDAQADTVDAQPRGRDAQPGGEEDSGSFRADARVRDGQSSPSGADSGALDQVPEQDAAAKPGTFSHIYEHAFKTCRTQCHLMGYSMLNMATRESAYAALVDQASNPGNMSCAPLGLKRVVPGAPEQSLLYLKLDILPPCGQQMPPGGLLKQELRDEVRAWIENGAKDD